MVPTIYVTHFEEDIYLLANSVILENGKIEQNGDLHLDLMRKFQ